VRRSSNLSLAYDVFFNIKYSAFDNVVTVRRNFKVNNREDC